MCGIFAYTGTEKAVPTLLDGLRTLEYRGYDSAGLFAPGVGTFKAVGNVDNLAKIAPTDTDATSGISHTRWATHGLPTETNAHPHKAQGEKMWLVHNGIIENYKDIREKLEKEGHTFETETDTEVLAHLIEYEATKEEDFTCAVVEALKHVRGTYGIAVMHADMPEQIITARMGSPIAIGIGNGENCIASDASAIIRHTKDILYLNDGEYAVITPDSYHVYTLDHEKCDVEPDTIEWDIDEVKKGGYDHYMLKEIMEGPEVLRNSARGRVVLEEGNARLGGLKGFEKELREIERLIIVACGTASYAATYGKYLIEELAGIPVEVEIGSEFRYRKMSLSEKTAVLAITQSGETADTRACIAEAKRKGLLTLGIVNVVGSTIARETDAGIYNHAGPEVSVASTKAYLSQLEVIGLLGLYLGRARGLSQSDGKKFAEELLALPEKVQSILDQHETIKALAEKYKDYRDYFYIGRKFNVGTAFEGSIKLKEITYIHSEAYAAGEMKHGPIALIDENFPTVAIVPNDSVYEKTLSNIEETKARKGPVIAIVTEGDVKAKELADDAFEIPETIETLNPILAVVPLHLFAYYMAAGKGLNVDRPRNLAKSVTVE